MKGRTEAAALLLLTSEQSLESLPRLKLNCLFWALSAESANSQPQASEPRRREFREALECPGTWQSCFWLYSCLTLMQSCELDGSRWAWPEKEFSFSNFDF